jgi:hypothetical protein
VKRILTLEEDFLNSKNYGYNPPNRQVAFQFAQKVDAEVNAIQAEIRAFVDAKNKVIQSLGLVYNHSQCAKDYAIEILKQNKI